MTSYKIEVGYNSTWKRNEVLPALKRVVENLQINNGLIVDEVLRLEPKLPLDEVAEYAAAYAPPVRDLTLRWDGDAIRMLASGGDPARGLKEACRRAFCRLVLEGMHRETMEVNIVVG